MKKDIQKYDRYKDSGIECLPAEALSKAGIGEIPGHWGVKKIKYLTKVLTGSTPKSTNADYWNGKINWVTTDDLGKLETKFIFDTRRKITEDGFKNSGTHLAGENSIVLSTRAPIGHLGILRIEACSNQGCKTIESNSNFNSEFLYYYLFSSKEFLNSLGVGTTFLELPTQSLRNLSIHFPPIEEQQKIATYLDRKTAEIDELIADKKRLIELYEEEKIAVINDLVTGKMNKDGIKNEKLKMKDSGIECLPAEASAQAGLGDDSTGSARRIPEDWEVKKLKYVANIVLGKMLTSSDKGGYFLKPYLRAANLDWLNVNVNEVKEMWFSKNEMKKYRLKRDDLLVSEGGEVGRTCIWKEEIEECYIQNSVHKVTMNNNCEPRYFLNQFYLFGEKGVFDFVVNRISIAHLTVEKLKEIKFLVPPLETQRRIVQKIETETARINAKKEKAEKLIELLTEYREALISEVVTGKVKVF